MVQTGNDLTKAIEMCRSLDNTKVQSISINKWTWENCYEIFVKVIK
jgi:hypothetical protein